MKKIYKRFIDQIIEEKMKTIGALLVTGPKFCGKTTTCLKFQKSYIRLNTDDVIKAIKLNPSHALVGQKPRLIDEWQEVPDVWNHIKNDLDLDYQFGKYLLTGSTTPVDKSSIYHGGAGRITTINMRPLTLSESEDSNNQVSLAKLFDHNQSFDKVSNDKTYEDVLYYICRGGWPLSLQGENRTQCLSITENYCNQLFKFNDSNNQTFKNKNVDLLKILLKSCARNVSTNVKVSTIINDIITKQERSSLDRKTFDEYFGILKDLFIIDPIDAWNPNLRSKIAITSSPTMHFTDPSIAASILNITPDKLLNDAKTAGLLFEDLAIRDLIVYSSLLNGKVKHYRDGNGRECDAVILLNDGRWGAVEIKLGGYDLEQEATKSLNSFVNLVSKSDVSNPPSFCMILTAFGQPRITKEGYFVVPITCLTK